MEISRRQCVEIDARQSNRLCRVNCDDHVRADLLGHGLEAREVQIWMELGEVDDIVICGIARREVRDGVMTECPEREGVTTTATGEDIVLMARSDLVGKIRARHSVHALERVMADRGIA